jgi:hypothetical protein
MFKTVSYPWTDTGSASPENRSRQEACSDPGEKIKMIPEHIRHGFLYATVESHTILPQEIFIIYLMLHINRTDLFVKRQANCISEPFLNKG